jgi:AcrR family transcriptional regulator
MTQTPLPPAADTVETAILRLARSEPNLGQAVVAERLRSSGLSISASGVRYIWQKHGLETAVKRLKALADSTPEGIDALSASQRDLLERGTRSDRLARDIHSSDDHRGGTGGGETPDRRQLILHAAARLFSRKGYDRTSIRDISREAGVLPGSVYHHFPSKDAIYLAVHREGFWRVHRRATAAAAMGSDPWDSLCRACEVHVCGMVGDSPIDRITGRSIGLTDHQNLLAMTFEDREAFEKLYRDLIAALPLAPDADRSLLRLVLLGALNWVYIWYREGRRTPEAIAAGIVDIVRRGVQG